jgi:glycosyltransferase involved in cell wall biosynthesis
MPNLLDVESYPDYSAEAGDGATMLFVANYSYAPNANAARLLLTQILPAVKSRVPSARLVLVGKGLSPELTKLAEALPEVDLAGFVGDLRPYYRRAAIVLLPVLEGAGMLVKTLEALSFGKAAIGFPQAFRGLGSDGTRPFVSVCTPSEFAERAAALLEDRVARAELAGRARIYAAHYASWERGIEILGNSLLSL